MKKTAVALVAGLVVAGCGTMSTVRVPGRGESALTLSCGGPVPRYLKVNAPMPYAVVRYDYGLTDRVGLGISWQGIGVDYAFAPYGKLGMTHRISLSYRGPSATDESFGD